jgi:hypothetical protein
MTGGLLAAALGWVVAVRADVQCVVCQRLLEEGEAYATVMDQMEFTERTVCGRCASLPNRCFLCTLPVRDNARVLPDKRQYCPRDAQTAVFDSALVKRKCLETRALMERPLARFMELPGANVEWTVEDAMQRAQAVGATPSRCGLAHARYVARETDGKWTHQFGILNGLPEDRLVSATAHLYAHAWLAQNLPSGRRLRDGTLEAACDLVALHCLESWGNKTELQRILAVPSRDGQLAALMEARQNYELFRVLEWLKYGAQDHLIAGDPDAVRRLDPKLQPVVSQVQVIPPPPAAVQAPDELTLKAIVGQGNRRLALINNATLAAGEEGRVQVGSAVLRVRCLEIRSDSVVIQVGDEPEKQELRLRKSAEP